MSHGPAEREALLEGPVEAPRTETARVFSNGNGLTTLPDGARRRGRAIRFPVVATR